LSRSAPTSVARCAHLLLVGVGVVAEAVVRVGALLLFSDLGGMCNVSSPRLRRSGSAWP
jgi:hypothetical protein